MTSPIHGLYAITPDGIEPALLMELVDAAIAGGANAVQYRDKHASEAERATRAAALLALCRARGVPLIINDHLPLALSIHADGLHLGRDDGALVAARVALGKDAIIGVSCYADISLAMTAEQQGASYVAFGSVFASPTKPAAPGASLSLFQAARSEGVSVPLVAIGGVNVSNIETLAAAGASSAAVIHALFGRRQRDAVFASARLLSRPFQGS